MYTETGPSGEYRGTHVFEFDSARTAGWRSDADIAPFDAVHEAEATGS